MNRILIDLGVIQIHWYSLIMLIAIISGTVISYFEIKKQKIDIEFFYDLVFWIIIFSFIGARIYFCLFNLDYYTKYPLEIFKTWNGGLAIHGGIIGGLLTIFIYCRKKKVNVLKMLDIFSIGLLLGQIIGRWGNFFNSEAHGPVTSRASLEALHIPKFIIDGMKIDGLYYVPTFLYESLWNLLGLIIILIIKKKIKVKEGQIFSMYFIWYGIGRFFIEGMRTDSLLLGNIKFAQVISIVLVITGLVLLVVFRKNILYNRKEKVK